jgi:hypothetical protein
MRKRVADTKKGSRARPVTPADVRRVFGPPDIARQKKSAAPRRDYTIADLQAADGFAATPDGVKAAFVHTGANGLR